VDNTPGTRTAEFEGDDGVVRRFRWLNGAPPNDANFDEEADFPECRERLPGAGNGASRGWRTCPSAGTTRWT
jgi:hypothetical protein